MKLVGENTFIKVLFVIIGVTLILVSLTLVKADGTSVKLNKVNDIDVALTVGATDIEVRHFEESLLNELESRGVNESRVNIQAFDTKTTSTETQDAAEIFADWESRELTPSGNVNEMSLGKKVSSDGWLASGSRVMAKEPKWRPARAWINPEEVETDGATEIEFEWGIDEKDYGSFEHGEAGFIFGVQDDDNFYVYIMDNHDACGHIRFNGGEAIIKVEDGKISEMDSYDEFPMYEPGLKQDVKIKINGNNITIEREGVETLNVVDESVDIIEGLYGFYVWDQHGAYFNNISFTTESKREFNEVIRQPEWRTNSQRYVVNMEDEEQSEFDDKVKLGEILTRLINERIDYIAVGSDGNREQAEKLIKRNSGNGTFINSKVEYERVIEEIANYIMNTLDEEAIDEYVLVDEKVEVSVDPADILENTESKEYPNGKWMMNHEYDYFENGSGKHEMADRYFPSLNVEFDKPGRYEIIFEKSNTFPKYIHAHRRPIAAYTIDLQESKDHFEVGLNDISYDPDASSRSDKGIESYEWKWKETTDESWTAGKIPNKVSSGKDYIVQLRVKDYQNVWSDPVARYITTSDVESQPIADFNMPIEALIYDDVDINDTSYDPSGKKITDREWVVTKHETEIYKGSNPLTDFMSHGDGRYVVSLKVESNSNLWSETFSRVINITRDNIKPTIEADLKSSDWTNEDLNVNLTFEDYGGSGLDKQRYSLSTSSKPDSKFEDWSTKESEKVEINKEGTHYIHTEALDNEGNKEAKSFGPYKLDKTNPTIKIHEDEVREPHENVTLSVDADDNLSGVKSITYIGENMIVNGDFSSGKKHWSNNSVAENNNREGSIEIKNGNMLLSSNVSLNKAKQEDAFKNTEVGAEYYSEVTARGVGKLNSRYGVSNGSYQRNYTQEIKDDKEFNVHRFKMERLEGNNNQFIMEKVDSEGWVEISEVELFAQKDITDTKELEVTKNGEYTFVVEDNAGNITAKSYHVDSIVRELTFEGPEIQDELAVDIGKDAKKSTSIGNLKITDWRDEVNNNWKLSVEASKLTGPTNDNIGVISMSGVDSVSKSAGGSGDPIVIMDEKSIIDDGSTLVIDGKESSGVFNVKFNKDALSFNIDSNNVIKGKYNTEITWTLEAAP